MKNAHILLAVIFMAAALIIIVFILLLQIQTQPHSSAVATTNNFPVDSVTAVVEENIIDTRLEQKNVSIQAITDIPTTTTAISEALITSNTVFNPYQYTKYKSEYVPNDIYAKYPNISTVKEPIQKDALTINGLQLQSIHHHFNGSQQKWVVRRANFNGENIPVSGMLTIFYNFAVGGYSTYFMPDIKTRMILPNIEKPAADTSDYFAIGVKMETFPQTPCTKKLLQAEDPMTINGIRCVFEVEGTIGEVSIEFFNIGIGSSGSTITFTNLTFPRDSDVKQQSEM